jgi:hypothetical protein
MSYRRETVITGEHGGNPRWIALAGVATIALTQPAVRRAGRAPADEGAYRPVRLKDAALSDAAG